MSRSARILCGILVLCLLFCGCNASKGETIPTGDQQVSCDELILTFPAKYQDLSGEEYAADFRLLYGYGDEAVLAFEQDRAALEPYYPDLTAEGYAQKLVEVNKYNCSVGKLGDLVTFSYTAITDGVTLTYLCAVYTTAANFWCVQFYCPSVNFDANYDIFMGYLQAVQVQEALTN